MATEPESWLILARSSVIRWRRIAAVGLVVLIVLIAVPIPINRLWAAIIGAITGCGCLLIAWLFAVRGQFGSATRAIYNIIIKSAYLRQLIKSGIPEDEALQRSGLRDRHINPQAPMVIKSLAALIGLGPTISFEELRAPLPFKEDLEERLRHIYAALAARRAFFIAIGPAWLALIFLTAWTSVSLLLWAVSPTAFTVTSRITLGDFIYFVINTILANVPPDITASSRLAHALFAAIILSGYALLTKYLLTLMADPRDRLIIAQQECENAEKEARKKIDKRLIDLSAASSGTPDND